MSSRSSEIRRLKWVFGTTYAVQGSSTLVDIPTLYFIKFVLGLGDAGGQLFQTLKALGWLVKPLWGFISDHFPLFGYRRKSWFIAMALLALLFWALIALCAFWGIRVPWVYLIGFNLAFSTYAFVDVVGDALMVEHGRKLQRVGSFINFQWTMLALSSAAVAIVSGWFQEGIETGRFAYWTIFLLTGVPPLFTATVGLFAIDETPVSRRPKDSPKPSPSPARRFQNPLSRLWHFSKSVRRMLKPRNEVMPLLVLFIIFWNFSPSIGYIERSYLIDVRGFAPLSFGIIFTAQAFTFLFSILTYRFIVSHWPRVRWYHYLYGVVAIMTVVGFPLSFYLYLDPSHPWWRLFEPVFTMARWNPLPDWNRYQWCRLLFTVFFGFATIPAFIIPLRLAGAAVTIESAGMSYAFLTALTNATNLIEGLAGSGLYWWFSQPQMQPLLVAFQNSPFNIAGIADQRTLILQCFVYIGLFFTLLTVPFVRLLRRAFERHQIEISDLQAS